ncbi:MAG: phosphoribosylglycinamide formyltransferase [Planctomycetes bacterium]|nr:phosphoribosylglycinamide formyltransferase [Planctomycetota bacterium]
MLPAPPWSIGFLLSGTGRTLDNLVEFLKTRPDLGRVQVVVSDRPGAKGLEKAEGYGIEHRVMSCRRPSASAAIFDFLDEREVDLVLLGGWLRLLKIPERWQRRVLNIHPSLIPKFSGEGFYGMRVHRAAIAAGERESGCTVHFVDDAYDHGEILLQERVPVMVGDTAEQLAERVFEAECRAYPRALERLAKSAIP